MPQHIEYLVIGGGPGGVPTAMALATAGKSVLLVEKGPGMGGTCLFEDSIPSKIFRESARRLRELGEASDFGLCLPSLDVRTNWPAVLECKRAILKRHVTFSWKAIPMNSCLINTGPWSLSPLSPSPWPAGYFGTE